MTMTTITANIMHMADVDVNAMVPPDIMEALKAKEEHPEIRVYAIGHEAAVGADLKHMGLGNRVLHYMKTAITKINAAVQHGVKFFDGHKSDPDASDTGRTPLGEVVGKAIKTIDSKLTALVAAYIYPEYRSRTLDMASFEANLSMSWNGDDLLVQDVPAITGIALGDSRETKPAFSGATLLATVQHFLPSEEVTVMTIAEIIAEMKAGTLTVAPTDLFDDKTLLAVPVVKQKVDQTGVEAARNVQAKATLEIDKLTADAVRKDQELATANGTILSATRGDMFGALATERKLTDPQKAYMAKNLTSFTTEETEEPKVKAALTIWQDAQLVEYRELATLMGVKEETPETPPNAEGDGAEPGGDLTVPKNNPMIP